VRATADGRGRAVGWRGPRRGGRPGRTAGVVAALSVALVWSTGDAAAQERRLHVGLAGTRATNNEASADNRHTGFGGSATARYGTDRWGVEGEVDIRSLSPAEDESLDDLSIRGGALRGHYGVWRDLDAEVGFESRTVEPELAAQDVAALLVGLRYEVPFASIASMRIRGAAIPLAWFNGGGDSGIGVAVGLAARIRPSDGRWGLFGEYDFRRLDRSVGGIDVPIQFESVRLGVELGF
jgi:hypothetical protein